MLIMEKNLKVEGQGSKVLIEPCKRPKWFTHGTILKAPEAKGEKIKYNYNEIHELKQLEYFTYQTN